MALESDFAVFATGIAGGAANELLHWWGLRENPHLPEYAKGALYWVITMGMVLLGGGLAWLQLGSSTEPLIAFQIGLGAPMVLQKLAASVPDEKGAMGAQKLSAWNFLRG